MTLVVEMAPDSQGVLKTLRQLGESVAVQVIQDWCRLRVCFSLTIEFKQYAIVEAKSIQDLLKLRYVSLPVRDDDRQSDLIW